MSDERPIPRYHDRELSWLAFNGRVLQEARDPSVPPLERLKFLAIFSSNLDEFFRVRVASLRTLLRLKKKEVKRLDFKPEKLLRSIHEEVARQQRLFGETFSSEILPLLEEYGICLSFGNDLSAAEQSFVDDYFRERVAGRLNPVVLLPDDGPAFLGNRSIYFVAGLWRPGERSPLKTEPQLHGLVELPDGGADRFVIVPTSGSRHRVLFVDDVIRANIGRLFPGFEAGEAYAVKMTRDAELYIEDELEGDLVEAIKKRLAKRDQGTPTRFLYDPQMPYPMVATLKEWLRLEEEDLVPGGRYHNYSDFFEFPDFGRTDIGAVPMPPIDHPRVSVLRPMLDCIDDEDVLFHFPYQSFASVVRLFEEAAADETVTSIRITLYRLARDSRIAAALMRAAQRGASVTAFVEVKARFDEEPNLRWAEEMESAGVSILYSLPRIKVHSKLALITREIGSETRHYTYLATGNFNEKTARTYTDHALVTSRPSLAHDALQVFDFLAGDRERVDAETLAVAPFGLRDFLSRHIEREIANASEGREAWILAKLNNLEDADVADMLYAASEAGVKIRLLVRGICTLIPGTPGLSENIHATGVVDRFLEHARAYVFCNDGDPDFYLGSADWMTRNLDHRIEVVFPITHPRHREQIANILVKQCRDNQKARLHDASMQNAYVERTGLPYRSQVEIYRYVAALADDDGRDRGRLTWDRIVGRDLHDPVTPGEHPRAVVDHVDSAE